MFSEKSENRLCRVRATSLVWIAWLVIIVSASSACAFGSRRAVLDPCEPAVEPTRASTIEPNTVSAASDLIYGGKFAAAGKLIARSGGAAHPDSRYLSELAGIVREYEAIAKKRQKAREAAYAEQLADLEKFRNGGGVDANGVIVADANAVDPNGTGSVSLVLAVVAKVREYADAAQKKQLLENDFVKETIQKAVDEAAEFEVEGKWLEAYTACYYWLSIIDPNNEGYSDYAEQLLDKAQISASFEDSPCETSKERYDRIKKEMFDRAVYALSVNYVSMLDYREMAEKALERCRLLAEVMAAPSAPNLHANRGGGNSDSSGEGTGSGDSADASGDEDERKPPSADDRQKLMAWSAALSAVEDEMDEATTGFNKAKFIAVFERVLTLNATIAELPETVLIAQFAEAALSALDPYTVMIWPKQVQDFEKMMTNEFTGIGIEIAKRQGLLTVASLLPDTPAYNSGLDAGDVIEKVDGVETKDMTLMCAVHKITGPKGTDVLLTVKRPGEDKTSDITITRDRITVPTIRGWQRTEAGKWLHMVDEGEKIGYVRLTSFSGESSAGLEKALVQLEEEGLKALILDLRFNTGGLLDSAVAVSDKFLDGGLIVKTQPGPGFAKWPSYSSAHKAKTHPNYPLVVLVNSSSASASEIVAGALADKEHKRAILVGTRTHGKGSVQGITHYPGGGCQLKYTMAYYHLPSNQRVESQTAMKKLGRTDWGVGANVEVKLRSDELKEMIDVQRDNDVLVQAGRNGASPELKKHTIDETLGADPQLAVGLLVVRSKLIQARASASAETN